MWEPEKLSNNAVDRLLFEFVYPKLLVWSKNRSWAEKSDLIQKVTINALGISFEKASSFLVSPDDATRLDACEAVACVASVFFPLCYSLKKWYILHESKGDAHDFSSIIYSLDKLYEEFQALFGQKKRA